MLGCIGTFNTSINVSVRVSLRKNKPVIRSKTWQTGAKVFRYDLVAKQGPLKVLDDSSDCTHISCLSYGRQLLLPDHRPLSANKADITLRLNSGPQQQLNAVGTILSGVCFTAFRKARKSTGGPIFPAYFAKLENLAPPTITSPSMKRTSGDHAIDCGENRREAVDIVVPGVKGKCVWSLVRTRRAAHPFMSDPLSS